MTGIIVTLIFIAGIVLFIRFGRHLSNITFKTPHWFETLKNAFGSTVAVLVVIAFFLVLFGIPVLLIINGYIVAASLLF